MDAGVPRGLGWAYLSRRPTTLLLGDQLLIWVVARDVPKRRPLVEAPGADERSHGAARCDVVSIAIAP